MAQFILTVLRYREDMLSQYLRGCCSSLTQTLFLNRLTVVLKTNSERMDLLLYNMQQWLSVFFFLLLFLFLND